VSRPWKEVARPLLESDVENECKKWARKRGWWVRKFKSPSNRSVMDDVFAKCGRVVWVEFKRPGKTSTDKQAEEQQAARAAGCEVYEIDNIPAFKKLFLRIESELNWLD
jgi:hypothetical protein